MRITESQLRSIVKRIIRENVSIAPDDPWISLDDVDSLLNEDYGRIRDALVRQIKSYSPDPAKVLDYIHEKLFETRDAAWLKAHAHLWPGEDPTSWTDEKQAEYEKNVDDWMALNEQEILAAIDEKLEFMKNEDDGYTNETDEIFGSEAEYWRYRNG